ncbi:uncharacterized protein LOC124442697 [Xenia sp. Carnegie-2017]|uniref:uncharacterized protein LOC124442697 n=1 Tax=Xenia sp. Carnegie-2017 TaxID=2897299 RepID=UPI001F03B59A|nr:uncharacterized protein LOC124442697 [Xenia sp. Carnegie-2017]
MLSVVVGFDVGPLNDNAKSKGFVGPRSSAFSENFSPSYTGSKNFVSVFAVFFPAATGILAGVNSSGDLRDAQKAIPKGIFLVIGLTAVVYVLLGIMSGSCTLRDATGIINDRMTCSMMECKYGLNNDFQAEESTLAVGQAFTLAYKRFKENQAVAGNDVNEMKERVETAEKENEVLRKKLEELEKINKKQATNTRPSLASIAKPRVNENNHQTFDSYAEKTAPVFESSSFDIQSPSPFPTEHRSLPPSIASNPFAMSAAESHAAQSHKNDGDLLGVYGSKESLTGVSSNDVNNMFDPLAEIDNNSQVSQSEQSAVAQNEHIYATVSRPKPAPLSTGLLPPPPSKQSIMEKNRNSGNKVKSNNGSFTNSGLGMQTNSPTTFESQNDVQNNLVIF